MAVRAPHKSMWFLHETGQTHCSASPLSAFFCSVFSHCLICTKNREAGFYFLLTHMLTGLLHVYPLGTDLTLPRWCFTSFATEQLYPPGALKQTQIALTCLSSSLFAYRIHTFEKLTSTSYHILDSSQ